MNTNMNDVQHQAPYIHGWVDLCHSLIVGGKLVDLDTIANQLARNLDFELC